VQSGQSPLLSPILNDAIGATAGGYDGLADSDLPLDHVVPFLPEFSGGVGTPDEVLDTDVYLGDFLLASADALRNDPDATGADLANAEVLEAIHADVDGQAQFRLGDLVGAEQGSEEAALQGDVNLLDLVAGSILLANGENAIAMPPPTVAIPGVLQVNTPCDSSPANDATEVCSALTVIERPVTFTGRPGASANTKQLALRNGISGGLVPLLDLAQTQVNLKAATGLAEIAAINCGDPRAVTALITTGLLETTVRVTGLITVDLFLTSITVPIVMTATRPPSSSFESVTFTEQPDGSFSPPNYEAGSQDLGLGNLTFTTTIGSTNSSVTAAVQTIVNGTVTPFLVGTLLPLIEQRLVIPVLKSLGANVSGADLAALAVGCNDLMLVG
jgi:hypothetical protein